MSNREIVKHSLKTLPAYWRAVWRGDKPFEVRRDDRGFQRDDVVLLRLLNSRSSATHNFVNVDGMAVMDEHHAATIEATITYVLTGGQFGIEPGYVVLGLNVTQRPAACPQRSQ